MTLIDASTLKEKLNQEDLVIIDVRETWEYEEENIGALNIPLGELPHRLSELDFCKSKVVVVHCKSGTRSNQAMKYLCKHGFTNVLSLEGGIEAYLHA